MYSLFHLLCFGLVTIEDILIKDKEGLSKVKNQKGTLLFLVEDYPVIRSYWTHSSIGPKIVTILVKNIFYQGYVESIDGDKVTFRYHHRRHPKAF